MLGPREGPQPRPMSLYTRLGTSLARRLLTEPALGVYGRCDPWSERQSGMGGLGRTKTISRGLLLIYNTAVALSTAVGGSHRIRKVTGSRLAFGRYTAQRHLLNMQVWRRRTARDAIPIRAYDFRSSRRWCTRSQCGRQMQKTLFLFVELRKSFGTNVIGLWTGRDKIKTTARREGCTNADQPRGWSWCALGSGRNHDDPCRFPRHHRSCLGANSRVWISLRRFLDGSIDSRIDASPRSTPPIQTGSGHELWWIPF